MQTIVTITHFSNEDAEKVWMKTRTGAHLLKCVSLSFIYLVILKFWKLRKKLLQYNTFSPSFFSLFCFLCEPAFLCTHTKGISHYNVFLNCLWFHCLLSLIHSSNFFYAFLYCWEVFFLYCTFFFNNYFHLFYILPTDHFPPLFLFLPLAVIYLPFACIPPPSHSERVMPPMGLNKSWHTKWK